MLHPSHVKAGGTSLDPYPLSPQLIDVAGTLLKKGTYRSAHLYLQAMKRVHLEAGHAWSEHLDLAIKDAIRSCTRGMGPDLRDLSKIAEELGANPQWSKSTTRHCPSLLPFCGQRNGGCREAPVTNHH